MNYFMTALSFFIILFTSFAISPVKCSSNETDLLALLNFKAGIDHDPFGFLNSWNGTSHFCTWNGVQCSNRHRNRVVAINLLSQALSGSISPHIGNLSFLRSITLQNNTFRGQIPQEFGRLRRLESINFSNNTFVGEIPRNLSHCLNLVDFNFFDNRLSGTIPHELGSLSKLQRLYLGKNDLSGQIPPFIGNLTSLTRIVLSNCGLEGEIPESLAQLRSLTYLSLGVNRLIGRVPLGLFNSSSITLFAVHANQLEGEIPSDIGLTLPNLRELYLGGNRFTGPVPVSLSNASFLEVIVLLMNNFTGPMPRVGTLLNLQTFTIALNHIQDDVSFISSLTNCTNLELLEIGDNPLTGSLPNSIANLSSNLWSILIPSAQIHGKIPPGFENLVGLTRFGFSGNFLDGQIPSGIGKLYNLREIDLGGNRFTNELPSSFSNLTSLTRLFLPVNNLSGSIAMLRNCTNLIELDLSYNSFNGSIPPEITNLPSITISFDLSHNSFEGSIPSEVGSLSNLVNLDLSNNRLSGVVPNSLSGCTSLQRLHLEDNLLEGEIPRGLSALMGLQDLDLSRNNLLGPIPNFLGNLRLEKLNLSYNRLQGEVPTQGIFRNRTAIFLDGNNDLCGGIHELELPLCPISNSSKKNSSTVKKILIPSGVLLFTLALILIIFIYRRRTIKKDSSISSAIDTQFLRLSYADLLKATDGFSEPMLIGKGQFGSVYKGILDEGQTFIAVKVLNLSIRGASKTFVAECNALRGLRHRNLLKILSVCESIDFQGNDFKALVYEFKANGSLEKWLHRSNTEQEGENYGGMRRLNMLQRLSIAIDIAHAVEYLHGGTDASVVHSDLKPSNILLDGDLTAYVGDFGLAKIISNIVSADESSNSIVIKGTIGYVAPEYATNQLVSIQGDIYSYGILLLEMFTNKRPTDDAFRDHVNLHLFVSNALPDNAMDIVDPLILTEDGINSSKIKDCVVAVLTIAVACSRTIPRDRILMTDVVKQLEKIRDFYISEDFI